MDGLIIKQPWIDLILSGLKVMEIRGNIPWSHKDKEIALIESGTTLIRGITVIHSVTRLWEEGWFKKMQKYHQIPDDKKHLIKYKKVYAWWMSKPKILKEEIHYTPKPGAVIWVKNVL